MLNVTFACLDREEKRGSYRKSDRRDQTMKLVEYFRLQIKKEHGSRDLEKHYELQNKNLKSKNRMTSKLLLV